MELVFSGQTHNTYGGGPVSWVSDLLEAELPAFGTAVESIKLTVFYPGKSANAHSSIPYVPPEKDTRRFERKRKALRVLWISRRQSEAQVGGVYLQHMTPEILRVAFDDVADALRFGLERLLNKDDFDKERLFSWLNDMRERSWGDGNVLQAKLKDASEKRRKKWRARAEADPWSVLHIDWSKMAPNAREILDDPTDWSEADDFSPHGNDTGADIFAEWSRYALLTPEAAAREIGWGSEFDLSNDVCWHDWVEINLALAFGHIKKSGSCPPEIATKAHSVLSKEVARANKASDLQYRDEFLARAERYCRILVQYT
ncbi:MAG: hypothetical protein AAFO78_13655 [Pseudomonadota bacterium]